jgi:hypothetical protein
MLLDAPETRVPVHVPASPLVHPPDGALYDPLAEFPSAETVPVKATPCPFSSRFAVKVLPESVPLRVPDDAQGVPLNVSWPETLLPFCVRWPAAEELKPNTLDCALICQSPDILMAAEYPVAQPTTNRINNRI